MPLQRRAGSKLGFKSLSQKLQEEAAEDGVEIPTPVSLFSSASKSEKEAHTLVDSSSLHEFILESLTFKSMFDRQEEVAKAHQKTFEWIFDEETLAKSSDRSAPPGSDFLRWLRDEKCEEGGIYWINGKAGSGKSTLLRFIYDHEKTAQNLKVWASAKPVTMAGFFFWTSGSFEQRSQAGLLRSLLHQLLDKHRELVSATFPEIWTRYQSMTTKDRIKTPISWSLQELMEGLEKFLHHSIKEAKICLFIDGLDEYDGNHGEIIEFFTKIVRDGGQDVKVCLSSRPWPVFEAAFKSVPNLELQLLTLEDRRQYVVDKFQKDARMRRIMRKEYEEGLLLMGEVVERADGVFLWVILVVRFLLECITTGDKVLDVTQRLQRLPTDLEEFFDHMLLKSQENGAIISASEIFQLIRAREIVCDFTGDHSNSSLSLWELALACFKNDELALRGPVEEPPDKEVVDICNYMKHQIKDTCAGLLEIHTKQSRLRQSARFIVEGDPQKSAQSLVQNKVTYLHRTVRDWLVYSPSVWDTICQYTAAFKYDPHINHVRSYVLQLKLPLEEPEHHRRLDEWWDGIVLSLTHARYIPHLSKSGIDLIDELDKTLCFYWLPKPSQQGDHWARNSFGSYEVRNKHDSIISHPFLSLATKFGLKSYVTAKASVVADPDIGYHGGKPLLGYATDFLINRRKTVFPLSSPTFVKDLLDQGQGPNLKYTDFFGKEETPWLRCLKLVREALRRGWISADAEELGRWTEIMMLFIEYGADVNAVILEDKWDPEITALGVIDAVYEKFEVELIERLRGAMISRLENNV
jgi:hypothetical protein